MFKRKMATPIRRQKNIERIFNKTNFFAGAFIFGFWLGLWVGKVL